MYNFINDKIKSFWELGNKRTGEQANWGTSELGNKRAGKKHMQNPCTKCHNTSNTCTMYIEYAAICLVSPSLQTPVVSWGGVRCHITHDYSSYILVHRADILLYNLVNSLLFRLIQETDYAVVQLLILYKALIVHLFILEVNIRWKTNQIMCVLYGIHCSTSNLMHCTFL
jgi:hypothetical protein